ncbi:MAG: DNA polymerase III subunit beta [Chloroflexi bacterium]|nr:DNA polymerase III subunit beta [Chloroflexota bacterium]
MKISCLQENLAKGLSTVGRAVATRSTLPVLSNILLATDKGQLKLSATNLEIGISCWVGAKIEEEGAVTVPARLLSDFVNQLPADRIDMALNARTKTLNLRCARYEANIKGIDAAEFPLIPTLGEDGQVSLGPESLREMIEQVTLAAATDESRPVLTGVLAKLEGDQLTLAASDGFRLSVRKAQLPQAVAQPQEVIIPARALQELGRVSAEESEAVQMVISTQRSQVFFHMTSVDLVSQLVEGAFPPYQRIIPASHATRTVLDTASFRDAIRLAFLFARDSANIVRVRVTPGEAGGNGHVTISATSAEMGDNVGEMDAQVEGTEVEIAFNARYLLDVLSVIKSAQVALETSTASSPGVIRPVGGSDFLHVIMPMHIAR